MFDLESLIKVTLLFDILMNWHCDLILNSVIPVSHTNKLYSGNTFLFQLIVFVQQFL